MSRLNDSLIAERFIRGLLPVLYVRFYRKDGALFLTEDGAGRKATPTGTTWTPEGRKFNGTSDHIYIPFPDFSGVDEYSHYSWFNWDGGGGGADGRKVVYESTPWNYVFNMYILATTNYLNSAVHYSDTTTNSPNGVTPITPNRWHFAAATFRRNNYFRIFLDGQEEVSAVTKDLATINHDAVEVGTYRNADNRWFSGLIGEMACFPQLLTPGTMNKLYQLTRWRYA